MAVGLQFSLTWPGSIVFRGLGKFLEMEKVVIFVSWFVKSCFTLDMPVFWNENEKGRRKSASPVGC